MLRGGAERQRRDDADHVVLDEPAHRTIHDAIAAFRRARPDVDLCRTLTNTVITTYGADFAMANTEFVKRDTGRRGRQGRTWVRTEAGWRGERLRVVSSCPGLRLHDYPVSIQPVHRARASGLSP
jgi:hypothetical protein